MQKLRIRNGTLTRYLLVAFVFVQSVSGFLHTHWHAAEQEPEIAHHHYPVSSIFDASTNLDESEPGLVEVDLQADGLQAVKINKLFFALMLFVMLLPVVLIRSTKRTRLNLFIPSSNQVPYQIPPLRAPPHPTN